MSVFRMLKERFFVTCRDATEPLDGRVVIATGSNTGLGYHAAVHLARLNPAKLILAVRSLDKGNKAVESIKKAVPDFKGDLQVWHLDQSSFKSVSAFIDRANKELDRLDILLANAAIATFNYKLTEDGHEEMFQVNGLSTGLLAVGLLPKLAEAAANPVSGPSASFKPHLTIVGSDAHEFAAFNERRTSGPLIASMDDEKNFKAMDRYNVTKLINIFMTRQIAQLPLAKGVVVNVTNPGLCISELRRDLGGITGKLLDAFAQTGEVGSKNLAYAATADTSSTPGAYLSATRVTSVSSYARSSEAKAEEEKLWKELKGMWTSVAPEQVKAALQ